MSNPTKLQPRALQDAPALIETVFPAQKVSFEAQKERKAVQSQTLTGLGSYWKGRKPLILVRAIVLGSLLPPTDNAEADLAIYERLMAFDDESLARRALEKNSIKPADIARRITLEYPFRHYFRAKTHAGVTGGDVAQMHFPLDPDEEGITIHWRGGKAGATREDKLALYRQAIATYGTYEQKADLCKRPEELDQQWLYEPVWPAVNAHYGQFGINAYSFAELVEQLGVLRSGHRPKVGDSFAGGGSIPFEAARLGCDAYASDLNPIACMLTWGAFNIIGADGERREEINRAKQCVVSALEQKIAELGIEQDEDGNRAKAYLYCHEARCPQTGWLVPLSPTWVVSHGRNVIAKLVPDHANKRFDFEIFSGVTKEEMKQAAKGTIQNGALTYELDGETFRTPISTLRGDFRSPEGRSVNKLRHWAREEFKPGQGDIFRERLYAILWVDGSTVNYSRQDTFFAVPSDDDLAREQQVEQIVAGNLADWQAQGFVPDMAIEPGYNTDQPIRERGWGYWHQFFNPRQLLALALAKETILEGDCQPELLLHLAKALDWVNKGCYFGAGAARESISHLFANQALNLLWNYGSRSVYSSRGLWSVINTDYGQVADTQQNIACVSADAVAENADIWITDPPYADAVNYHEIYDLFIAWLRKNPPPPFDQWTWDSRRALAIKGDGDDFRRGMVESYTAMANHMPDSGMQCVMFTHQDTNVWGDLVGIFWASGLQVVAAWYIATETTSELKKGGYVQGTVILMLRKRRVGDRPGFKQRILPAVRREVQRQIESMLHLNDEVKDKHGEPVFNDSDLQMAGYAAALKVLTAYTSIGGEDVTSFALRPRARGEVTVVDEIVQQASEAANSQLVPDGLHKKTWARLSGIQRFYLRMMDMETTGASKLDNYQNFAKAFRVADYSRVMGHMQANAARLKRVTEFASRDLTDNTEIGPTWLGHLIIGLQQLLKDIEPKTVIQQFQQDLPDFMEARPLLGDMLAFIEHKAPEEEVREAAEVLGARLKNQRFGA